MIAKKLTAENYPPENCPTGSIIIKWKEGDFSVVVKYKILRYKGSIICYVQNSKGKENKISYSTFLLVMNNVDMIRQQIWHCDSSIDNYLNLKLRWRTMEVIIDGINFIFTINGLVFVNNTFIKISEFFQRLDESLVWCEYIGKNEVKFWRLFQYFNTLNKERRFERARLCIL